MIIKFYDNQIHNKMDKIRIKYFIIVPINFIIAKILFKRTHLFTFIFYCEHYHICLMYQI